MKKIYSFSLSLIVPLFTSCLTEARNEVTQNTDVKNLKVSFRSLSIDSVISPSEQENSNAAGVYLSVKLNIDNSGSSTVKTQGLLSQTSFNNIQESPLELQFSPFSIEAKTQQIEEASSVLNFESQKETIDYIITQSLDDSPLESQIQISILYDLIDQQGSLDLPKINQNIPTDQIPSDVITQMQDALKF